MLWVYDIVDFVDLRWLVWMMFMFAGPTRVVGAYGAAGREEQRAINIHDRIWRQKYILGGLIDLRY